MRLFNSNITLGGASFKWQSVPRFSPLLLFELAPESEALHAATCYSAMLFEAPGWSNVVQCFLRRCQSETLHCLLRHLHQSERRLKFFLMLFEVAPEKMHCSATLFRHTTTVVRQYCDWYKQLFGGTSGTGAVEWGTENHFNAHNSTSGTESVQCLLSSAAGTKQYFKAISSVL